MSTNTSAHILVVYAVLGESVRFFDLGIATTDEQTMLDALQGEVMDDVSEEGAPHLNAMWHLMGVNTDSLPAWVEGRNGEWLTKEFTVKDVGIAEVFNRPLASGATHLAVYYFEEFV